MRVCRGTNDHYSSKLTKIQNSKRRKLATIMTNARSWLHNVKKWHFLDKGRILLERKVNICLPTSQEFTKKGLFIDRVFGLYYSTANKSTGKSLNRSSQSTERADNKTEHGTRTQAIQHASCPNDRFWICLATTRKKLPKINCGRKKLSW